MTLEPFAEEHRDGLWEAAQADEIWAWLAHLNKSREFFDDWFDLTLASDATRGGEAGRDRHLRRAAAPPTARLVGSSRYLGVRRHDRVVEIGWTWFNPSVWRTGVNVETKLLMFTRAFETLGCVRVELKTDARNERSRGAMAAPARPLRGDHAQAQIIPDVGQRDSAYFSVIDDEWPDRPRRPRSPPHLPLTGRKLSLGRVFGPSTSSLVGRPGLPGGRRVRRRRALLRRPARVAATASSVACVTPSLGLPPTMSRKASLKRSVRRPGVEALLRPSPVSSGAARRSGGAPRPSPACRSGRSRRSPAAGRRSPMIPCSRRPLRKQTATKEMTSIQVERSTRSRSPLRRSPIRTG